MEIVHTCPLGHTCEEAKDGKIYRCRWFVRMGKADPTTKQIIPDSDYDECAIPLQGLHLTELKRSTTGVQGAVEKRMNSLIRLAENPGLRRIEDGN